jgi:hypothetical protein
MRKVGGATGVVGRQPVPMPVNGGREVTATTTGSKAGVPAAAGTETAGHARPGRSSDPSGPDRGATRDRRVPGAGGVAVRHDGAHVRPVLRGDQPAAHRGNPNPTAAVCTIGGTPVVAQSFRGSGLAPGGPPAPAGQGRAGRAADISALAREARGRALRATGPARYTALTPSEKSIPLRTNAPVSPTRRAVLQTIATILALAALAVLAGCGTSTTPTPGATAGGVAPSTQVMIIRHGEKPDDTNPGVDANGNQDDTSLTEIARWALITYLTLALCLFTWAAARPAPPAGPGSAAVLAGCGTSTKPAPGATAGGVAPSTRPTPGATAGGVPPSTQVMIIRHVPRQHGEIPPIAAAFPSVTPTPPSQWPDDRFDVVWTLAKTADGWHFAQTPELTLPQDQAGVIENDHQPLPGDSRSNGRDDHHTA